MEGGFIFYRSAPGTPLNTRVLGQGPSGRGWAPDPPPPPPDPRPPPPAAPRRPTRTRDTSVVAARAAGGPRTGFGAAPSRCHSADRGDPAAAAGRPPR